MIEIVLSAVMAAFMLYYGLKPVVQHAALRKNGKKVSAHIENTGRDRKGSYFTLKYEENGVFHFVQYPCRDKNASHAIGDTVALYVDTAHPGKFLLEDDHSSYATTAFCLICAVLLMIPAFCVLFQ